MKNTIIDSDDTTCVVEETVDVDTGNEGCQVRRKIEDYLERRRYKDDLGE